MKRMLIPALVLSLASATACASAGKTPIFTVTYNPNEVIPIYTAIGVPTLIQFEDDEVVKDEPDNKSMLGMGDSKAWKVGPKGSNVMLKPTARRPDTKLLIVTNKRSYAFDLVSVPEKSKLVPTLILRFDFPDSRAKAAAAANVKKSVVQERLDQIADRGAVSTKRNVNYMMRGHTGIAPTSISDDGRFTFMQFDSTRELPVAYKVLPDGQESLTNYHMESDTGTMVIHETAGNFMLRYGTAVLAIRNDGFNPDGKLNVSGTTVPNAVRLPRGAQ
jgi:type IV secretion system protein VirB9